MWLPRGAPASQLRRVNLGGICGAAPSTAMLARSGPIPTRSDWSFEVKWDGFPAVVSTEGAPLRIRSRRGWDMTPVVPELSCLPVSATFDGELVAFGPDGAPDFPLLCERMLMRPAGHHDHLTWSRLGEDKELPVLAARNGA